MPPSATMHEPKPDRPPHKDPSSWGRLIDSLDVAAVFVVIDSWLGSKLERLVAAEDIWQETLWLSWRDREQHQWRNLANYRAWLLSIAQNRVRDAARNLNRKKRGGEHQIAGFSDLAGNDSVSGYLPPGSTTPSRVAGHRERAQVMAQALAALPPELRGVVHLRLFEELPMREVAERLQIPLSTAKERLLRGVTRYRDRLRSMLSSDSQASTDPS